MVNNPVRLVTKYNVAQLLNAAYEKASILRNAVSGFRFSGIVLFPDVFPESDFAPTLLTEISAKDASLMSMLLNQEALVNLIQRYLKVSHQTSISIQHHHTSICFSSNKHKSHIK